MVTYSQYELEEEYDDMIDECSEEIKIGYISFLPSRVLKECDPIAYRCGLSDYASDMNLDWNGVEWTDEDEEE